MSVRQPPGPANQRVLTVFALAVAQGIEARENAEPVAPSDCPKSVKGPIRG
jgi:hypothetical protein